MKQDRKDQNFSYSCQPIKAAAHTQLTYENAQIYMYTIYQPSLLKIQGQNQRVSLQVTVGLLVWFGQNVEFTLLHYIQQKKLNF